MFQVESGFHNVALAACRERGGNYRRERGMECEGNQDGERDVFRFAFPDT